MARIDWPFKRMQEGEKLVVWNIPRGKVSIAAHTWARQAGAKVATRTVHEDGRTGLEVELMVAPTQREGRTSWPFKDLQPGDKTAVACEDTSGVFRARIALQHYMRYHGSKFKTKTVQQDDGTYLFLVKRLNDDQP